jgi:hypothetical protein
LYLNFKLYVFVINGLIKGEIKKPSDQFLSLIVISHWLGGVWSRIRDGSVVLPLSLFYLENLGCLSRGVQMAGVAWRVSMMIMARVGDLVQRIRDDSTGRVLGSRVIERSGGTMCGLHRARGDEESGSLGWASKSMSTVCQWFVIKMTRTVFSGSTSKPVATVSWLRLKTKVVEGFSV